VSTTPEWRVDEWDLRADLAKIEQQWSVLRNLLTDATLFHRGDEEVSGWTCGQHAGHLALVTQWIGMEIEQNLREPSRDTDGEWEANAETVLSSGDFPRGEWNAPAAVNPGGRTPDDFLVVLSDAEARWRELRLRSDALADCPARFHHFVLGYLTSTDWVRFCAIHSAHHLAVVRDIRGGTTSVDLEGSDRVDSRGAP
jgi:hypothetical protein